MKYKHGYVLGKFLPCTLGHLHLINTALEKSNKVTLLICSLESEPISGELRFNWLKEIYKNENRITIKHCSEELPQYPEEHENFWNIWLDVARRYCTSDIDCLFTSELYGEPYSKYLEIDHYMVDLERKRYPVSGTKVRNETFNNWEYIPKNIKPYFTKKIAIVGPESVGKSMLSKNLANYFNTNFVIEYGRTVYENNGNKVSIDDFIPISKGRQGLEDWLLKSSNKLLFCDTEDITTYIFSKMYYPKEYKKIERYFSDIINSSKKYDLYILLSPDCEAIQDGTRNHLDFRWEHFNEIKLELEKINANYMVIGGDWKNRFDESIKICNDKFNI